ncbi:FtsX-like permease family protein [Streptomyces sp. NPDC048172]|uniref:FtsX-like permease family protein n=1 Tax=Streptomyces sp. NPDC048172 TaxID=3365505 RepID=UPI003717EDC2
MSLALGNGLARASVRARPSAFGGVFAVFVLSSTVVTSSVAVWRTASAVPDGALSTDRREALTSMGAGFTLVTVYLSFFVIGQVMGLAVAQRARENALLRAVGALPWQLRRMVAVEALLTALPALPVGYVLGRWLAGVWCEGMAGQGLLPRGVELRVGWPPLLVSAAVLVVTSQIGGVIAAHRAARARPSAALGEAASGGRAGLGPVRAVGAVLALGGAAALTAATLSAPADEAAEHLPLVLLAYLVAVGLAGPALGRLAAGVFGLLLRALGDRAEGELAVSHARAHTRRLSSAIAPVALMVAFSLVKFAAMAGQDGDPSWIDLYATALYAGFAALVTVNTMVMLTAERGREIALLRAVGTSPGQILRALSLEALVVTAAGLASGSLIALTLDRTLGTATSFALSSLPPTTWPALSTATALLILTSTLTPMPWLLRRGTSG